MNDYRFEEEETWKLARELAWDVYSITSRGAFEKDYLMRNSVRRASFAIMANVAEGVEKGGTVEFIRHLTQAKDELGELRQQLEMAQASGFVSSAALARLEMMLTSLGCMISALMTSINQDFIGIDSVSVNYQGS